MHTYRVSTKFAQVWDIQLARASNPHTAVKKILSPDGNKPFNLRKHEEVTIKVRRIH